MKRSFLLLLLLGFARLAVGQTWLSPVIGYDMANIQNEPKDPRYLFLGIVDTGYAVRSLVWGARLEQQLGRKFTLAYQFGYSEKLVSSFSKLSFPIDGIRFQQFRNTVAIRYFPVTYIHFSLGGDLILIRDGHIVLTYGDTPGPLVTDFSRDEGLQFAIGGHFKQLELELYYHHGLKKPENFRGIDVLPFRSIGASLSYRFKVLGRKKRR